MKRVRVRKGKHVVVSAELAEKAARVFGTGFSRDAVRSLAALVPDNCPTLMVGSSKPLALSKQRARTAKKSAGGK